MTIRGASRQTFGGFMLQARLKSDDSPVGAFGVTDGVSRAVRCSAQHPDATLTHTDTNDKDQLASTWTAPAGVDADDVYFVATVAQNFNTYWVGIRGEEVQGDEEPEPESAAPPALAATAAAALVSAALARMFM